MRHLFFKLRPGQLAGLLVLKLSLLVMASGSLSGERLPLPDSEVTATLRETAMPELGQTHLEKILARYYEKGLGGSDQWDAISSIILSGTLKQAEDELGLSTLMKKPNLVKMILRTGSHERILAYDGETAWRRASSTADSEPIPPKEARAFVHSAQFGNYLIFPYAEGKVIEFIDTVPMEGAICHHIRVTLESDFQVDHFIGVRDFNLVKKITTDLRNGHTQSQRFLAYNKEFGVPIATQIESYKNGEWVNSLKIEEIRVNTGVMPWMFKQPR